MYFEKKTTNGSLYTNALPKYWNLKYHFKNRQNLKLTDLEISSDNRNFESDFKRQMRVKLISYNSFLQFIIKHILSLPS